MNKLETLDDLLERPMSAPAEDVLRAIEAGPMDPADALPASAPERLLEPGELPAETGWCRLADGCGYTAVRTPMPGVDGEMLDWWFEWHPHDPLRYRVWYPGAHADISFEPAPAAPAESTAKPYWNTFNGPLEDIGLGMQRLRIRFLDPVEFGFPEHALRDPSVATIVCGVVGDERRRAWHTRLCHFARRTPDGVELRSRFWLGAELRLFSASALASPVNRVLSSAAVRRRLVPRRAPLAMARHCAAEFANLASLLPQLYGEYR
jgi:DAPG hydrolase PhiG domain